MSNEGHLASIPSSLLKHCETQERMEKHLGNISQLLSKDFAAHSKGKDNEEMEEYENTAFQRQDVVITYDLEDSITACQQGGRARGGVGKRVRSEQSKFKNSLIKAYDAATYDPQKSKVISTIYDNGTGIDKRRDDIIAHTWCHIP